MFFSCQGTGRRNASLILVGDGTDSFTTLEFTGQGAKQKPFTTETLNLFAEFEDV